MGKGVLRVQSAAAVQHIADAGRRGASEGSPDVKFIIRLQIGTVNDTEQVMAVVLTVPVRLLPGNLKQLVRQAVVRRDAILMLQHGGHGQLIFF